MVNFRLNQSLVLELGLGFIFVEPKQKLIEIERHAIGFRHANNSPYRNTPINEGLMTF